MSASDAAAVERWTPELRIAIVAAAVIVAVLAIGPAIFSANAVDKLTTLFIYVILAVMWNALVGFCGLVSIGQQAFFGLGAYAAIRLADFGVSVYPSLFLGALIVGALSWPLSLAHAEAQGRRIRHRHVGRRGTGASARQSRHAGARRNRHVADRARRLCERKPPRAHLLVRARRDDRASRRSSSALLRSPLGAAIQAIRDNEEAAESIGVRVDARQAARVHARRLRRGARRRAVGGDGAHLPAARPISVRYGRPT